MKRVPSSVVRRSRLFPAGHYLGEIAEVKDEQNPDSTIESVGFRLINNTAVEADKEPGNQIHFMRIPVWMTVQDPKRRGKQETVVVYDIDPEDENVPFLLRNACGQWAQLAVCLDRATVADDGAVEFADDLEAFVEEFRTGEFEGQTVEFIVSHRKEKKDGKVVAGGRTFVDTVFVIPETGEGAEEVEDEEEEAPEDEEDEDEVPEDEVEEEEEEEPEEEAPATPKRGARSLVKGAKAREKTTKASGAKKGKATKKGSGRSKFARRKK